VESEKKRTRAFQALLGKDGLIRFRFKLRAHCSVWPNDAHDIGAGLFSQAEMNYWTGYQLLLQQQPGSNLHFAANTKAVDTLITRSLRGARTNRLPVIVLCAVVDCLDRTAQLETP